MRENISPAILCKGTISVIKGALVDYNLCATAEFFHLSKHLKLESFRSDGLAESCFQSLVFFMLMVFQEWNGKLQILGAGDLMFGIWKQKPPDFGTITPSNDCKVEDTDLIPIFPPKYPESSKNNHSK
ncbi:uncharacterized protein LOC131252897 isoform X2 [Magnolia sinica]|uniref:uncharacterized protein LOC131252897 isoform X2 n=1 Tax=Magnolia sinica TaxID=86752 RepID=UPI002659534C|nr:uncharacterized protein LOC131252897 isoform X2 [Magnolia sinica]